jgi:DNA-binding NarL/FixJ family response regulator
VSTDSKPIRILTADDHHLLRYGISALVGSVPDMELVAQASTGQEAIEQFRLHQPDVTLMDLQMPGMSGIDPATLNSPHLVLRVPAVGSAMGAHPNGVQVLAHNAQVA